jgi:hypothetical protein
VQKVKRGKYKNTDYIKAFLGQIVPNRASNAVVLVDRLWSWWKPSSHSLLRPCAAVRLTDTARPPAQVRDCHPRNQIGALYTHYPPIASNAFTPIAGNGLSMSSQDLKKWIARNGWQNRISHYMQWERKALLRMPSKNDPNACNAFQIHFQSIAGLMIVLIADDAPHSASQIKWKYRPAVFCLSHVLYIHRLIIHKLSKEQ